MNVDRLVLAVAVLAAVGVGAAVRYNDRSELDRLSRQVARLRSSPPDRTETVVVERMVPVALPDPPVAAPSASVPALPAMKVDRRRDQQGGPTDVESSFAAQRWDPSWSGTARGRILERATPLLPSGSKIDDVECRESLCRVESSHTSVAALEQFMNAALHDPDRMIWSAPSMLATTPSSDGHVQATLFLAKEGEVLPVGAHGLR